MNHSTPTPTRTIRLNVTNPEHSQHHIVTPLQYTYVYAALLFVPA